MSSSFYRVNVNHSVKRTWVKKIAVEKLLHRNNELCKNYKFNKKNMVT